MTHRIPDAWRELPDDIRVPLHSLWADAEYLISRARLEPDNDLFAKVIKEQH